MKRYITRSCSSDGELQQLLDSLAIRNRVLEASQSFSAAVSGELAMEPLCDAVVELLADIFDAETTLLYFLDERTLELYVKRRVGLPIGWPDRLSSSGGSCEVCRAFIERRLVSQRLEPWPQHAASSAPPPSLERPIVAVPLIAKQTVKGVLAMVWRAGTAPPDEEDLRLLDALSWQIAAAIDTAWLYSELTRLNEGLEQKVEERTAELNESNRQLSAAIDRLKQAQIQLVQQEKMASLGQLMAGIAHEINNPLAFSINNIALGEERLSLVELRSRLAFARLEFLAAASIETKVELGLFALRWIAEIPRYRNEATSALEEAEGLPPEEKVELVSQFLRYAEAREEASVPREELLADVKRLLARARDGLGRVTTIVRDLHGFSRIDGACFQPVCIDDGIERTLSLVAHLARERDIELRQERGLSAPYACHLAKLSQVVLNLTTNALQATGSGGTVTVRTRETESGPQIEVADTGCGISAENLTRIFDPFFTTKPVGQGIGLGLCISYKIVEEHGGTIKVESELDKGTSFTISLPPRRHG